MTLEFQKSISVCEIFECLNRMHQGIFAAFLKVNSILYDYGK